MCITERHDSLLAGALEERENDSLLYIRCAVRGEPLLKITSSRVPWPPPSCCYYYYEDRKKLHTLYYSETINRLLDVIAINQ